MNKQVKILLQTTIPFTEDDWYIGRFSLLSDHLKSLKNNSGYALYEVITRDRETNTDGSDLVLNKLDESDFEER